MSASNTNTKRQIVLAIELSNPSASTDAHAAALFSFANSESELIGSMPIPEGIRSSDAIMVLVESLCAEHEIKPTDITRILVSVGPGGYTALRIATTTAKVLAHTIGCSLVAVPTANVAAVAIDSAHRPALIALASKNNLAHCSVAHADGQIEAVGVIDASKIESLNVRSIFADSFLPKAFVEAAEQQGIEVHPIVLDAQNCLVAASGIPPIAPIELAPIYAREPDAITQWRERKKK